MTIHCTAAARRCSERIRPIFRLDRCGLLCALTYSRMSLEAAVPSTSRRSARSVARAATSRCAGVQETQIDLPTPRIHWRARVVFPYPAGARNRIERASLSSRALMSLGRSMIRCSRTLDCPLRAVTAPACVEVGRATRRYSSGLSIGRGPRPRRRVSPRAPLRRQPPLSARADARRDANGSSPVSNLNATGICRLRGTPSFCRSASQWAFAVLGEMPSAMPTSSFDMPCAINSMTSRCREVMPEGSWSACMTGG